MSVKLLLQFALTMLIQTSSVTQAQVQNQLLVTLTNGQTDAFYVSDIRSIKFENTTMNVIENNGVQSTWAIADIYEYSFKGANAIGQAASTSNQLKLFPNPVSDQLSMEYWSNSECKISIELVDMNGKLVRTVFEGTHHGKQTYTWTNDLPSGVYVCRIVSKYKSISQPVVIQ